MDDGKATKNLNIGGRGGLPVQGVEKERYSRGHYFRDKEEKLRKQQELVRLSVNTSAKSEKMKKLFEGVVVWVNGVVVNPNAKEIEMMMIDHGGEYSHNPFRKDISHIVANNLPTAKVIQYLSTSSRKVEIIRPAWIVDSIRSEKRLSTDNYLLEQLHDPGQKKLDEFHGGENDTTSSSSSEQKCTNNKSFLTDSLHVFELSNLLMLAGFLEFCKNTNQTKRAPKKLLKTHKYVTVKEDDFNKLNDQSTVMGQENIVDDIIGKKLSMVQSKLGDNVVMLKYSTSDIQEVMSIYTCIISHFAIILKQVSSHKLLLQIKPSFAVDEILLFLKNYVFNDAPLQPQITIRPFLPEEKSLLSSLPMSSWNSKLLFPSHAEFGDILQLSHSEREELHAPNLEVPAELTSSISLPYSHSFINPDLFLIEKNMSLSSSKRSKECNLFPKVSSIIITCLSEIILNEETPSKSGKVLIKCIFTKSEESFKDFEFLCDAEYSNKGDILIQFKKEMPNPKPYPGKRTVPLDKVRLDCIEIENVLQNEIDIDNRICVAMCVYVEQISNTKRQLFSDSSLISNTENTSEDFDQHEKRNEPANKKKQSSSESVSGFATITEGVSYSGDSHSRSLNSNVPKDYISKNGRTPFSMDYVVDLSEDADEDANVVSKPFANESVSKVVDSISNWISYHIDEQLCPIQSRIFDQLLTYATAKVEENDLYLVHTIAMLIYHRISYPQCNQHDEAQDCWNIIKNRTIDGIQKIVIQNFGTQLNLGVKNSIR